jgi:GMP synthase-like glutamine amidotransferase
MIETPTIITTQFHPEFMHNQASEEFFKKIQEWAAL